MGLKITRTVKYFLKQIVEGCPVELVLKAFLSHLNPNVQALFERPKLFDASKFNPVIDTIWYDVCKFKLGHARSSIC